MTPHAVGWGRFHIDLYHFMIDFHNFLQQKHAASINMQASTLGNDSAVCDRDGHEKLHIYEIESMI
jgi:hypothetical protein